MGNAKYRMYENKLKIHFVSCSSANSYDLLSEDKLSPRCVARQKAVICGQNGLPITYLTFFSFENETSEIRAIKAKYKIQSNSFHDALLDYKLEIFTTSVLKLNIQFRK